MDILFENGTIRTLERNSPDAQALLVRNGRIAAVGGRTAVEDQTGIDVRRVDLAGRTLLPAFLDAHSHFTAVANQFLQVSLEGCTSWADMQDRIRDYIRRERIPAGQWVTAQGYDHNLLSERRHPDRLCLDAAAPDNPVVIGWVSLRRRLPPPEASSDGRTAPSPATWRKTPFWSSRSGCP